MPSLRQIAVNCCISLLSLALMLIACEASLRLMQQINWLPIYSKKSIDKGDTPNKQVNAKLVRSDNPVLFMEFDRQDPNINNAGYRGPDFHLERTPGTARIAILGDSVAYGYSVPYEQTFAAQLASRLTDQLHAPVEIYNFAVNGYSTVAELELYRTKVRAYKPDVVILAYVLNDPLPAAFVVQSVGSARKQVDRFGQLARYSQLAAWAWVRWQRVTQPWDVRRNYDRMYNTPDVWQGTVTALQTLQQETAADGVQFGVVVFPLLLPFDHYPFTGIHQQVNGVLQASNIPHIDLLTAFSTVNAISLRPHPNDDTHPNAQGHALAIEQILPLATSLLSAGQSADVK